MTIFKSIKGVLSTVGLGQDELEDVFKQTIKRLDEQEISTPERCLGQAQAIEAMIGVLRDEDVMSTETAKKLRDALERWGRKGPKKTKS